MAIDQSITTILPFSRCAKKFQRGFLLIELLAAFGLLSGVVFLFASYHWRHTQQLHDARVRLMAVSHAREFLDQAIIRPDMRNTNIKKDDYTITSRTYPLEVAKQLVVHNITVQTEGGVDSIEVTVAWLDASSMPRSIQFASSVIT